MRELVKHPARKGTERQRVLYLHMREALAPQTSLPRRLLARKAGKAATLGIPRPLGFKVFPPGYFPEAEGIVTAARDVIAGADIEARARAKKPTFMIPTLDHSRLTLSSPFLRFALRPDVIASISTYLGVVPILTTIDVFYSHAGGPELKSSQLFHCDNEEVSQIKIFVLCSEVTPANGPLTVMGAETSKKLRSKIDYKYGERVKDDEAEGAVGGGDRHEITGLPGTVAFVDTSRCFHYGSRVQGDAEPRTVTVLQYITPFSFMLPKDYQRGAGFRHLATPEMPKAMRLVLGAE